MIEPGDTRVVQESSLHGVVHILAGLTEPLRQAN